MGLVRLLGVQLGFGVFIFELLFLFISTINRRRPEHLFEQVRCSYKFFCGYKYYVVLLRYFNVGLDWTDLYLFCVLTVRFSESVRLLRTTPEVCPYQHSSSLTMQF